MNVFYPVLHRQPDVLCEACLHSSSTTSLISLHSLHDAQTPPEPAPFPCNRSCLLLRLTSFLTSNFTFINFIAAHLNRHHPLGFNIVNGRVHKAHPEPSNYTSRRHGRRARSLPPCCGLETRCSRARQNHGRYKRFLRSARRRCL